MHPQGDTLCVAFEDHSVISYTLGGDEPVMKEQVLRTQLQVTLLAFSKSGSKLLSCCELAYLKFIKLIALCKIRDGIVRILDMHDISKPPTILKASNIKFIHACLDPTETFVVWLQAVQPIHFFSPHLVHHVLSIYSNFQHLSLPLRFLSQNFLCWKITSENSALLV